MKNKYPHIFEPITVRRMTVKNRIVMTDVYKRQVIPSTNGKSICAIAMKNLIPIVATPGAL